MEIGNISLKKHDQIIKGRLDKNQYTLSLLMEGFRCGLIDTSALYDIQSQIMLLLKDLISGYTKGESSSVTVETAERIMNSILYSIDAAIEPGLSPNEAIDILTDSKISDVYSLGVEKIKSCVEETIKLYNKIRVNKLDIPLEAYNSTIDYGFNESFEKYDMIFSAHDIKVDIDYPLANDDTSIRGILYIRQYLEKLKMENEFCSLFDNHDIKKILYNYGRIYNIDYTVTLTNIFEIVLNNSIFSVLSGYSSFKLIISSARYELIEDKLSDLNTCEIRSCIDEAVLRVISELNISNDKLTCYIDLYKETLAQRVVNAIATGNLKKLVITENDNESTDSMSFMDGDRMDDRSFRITAYKIMKSVNTADKIRIVRENIHSLQDLTDIFDADCFFEDEFIELFNGFDDVQIAVLGRMLFCEELRDAQLKLSSDTVINKKTENEWQSQYIKFVQILCKDRRDSVESLINAMV